MHRYIIKNTEDFIIVLRTSDGRELRMKPGSHIQYQTRQEGLCPVLTRLFNRGNIEYWRLEVREIEDLGKVEWQKEGF